MKQGMTIQDAAKEIMRQSQAKADYLVNTANLHMETCDGIPILRLLDESGVDRVEPLDILTTAHRQMSAYLNIPWKYYERMHQEDIGLLAQNVNTWLRKGPEQRMIRTIDGRARAFLSNRYRRIDNIDIARITLPIIQQMPDAIYESCNLSDDYMFIKVVNPRLTAEVVPGDIVQAGVVISNSETGQVEFILCVCEEAGIPFYILDAPLYQDFLRNFGQRRTVSIPWWTLMEDGHKSKMPRNCTIDYKVELIAKFIRWELLGYKKGQRLRPEDVKAHELHMGFSAEEKHRCKENPNQLFVNKFPLVKMGLIRADNYKYILEKWGLDTKASACAFCPFHRNYFYQYVQRHEPETYAAIVGVDNLLRDKTPMPPMKSALFVSRSRKRITDLTPEDCNDAECFEYCGQQVWNGF